MDSALGLRSMLSTRLAPALLLTVAAGCGGSEGGPAAPGRGAEDGGASAVDPSSVAPLPAGEARPFASESFGAIHGVVRVVGDVPERFPIGARKHSDCTSFPDVEHLSDVIVVTDGKVQGSFVQLTSGYERGSVPPAPAEDVLVDQRGCIYTPHVSALQTGQRLLVGSSDPATHNVNVRAPRNAASRNVSMVRGQEPLEFLFRRAESVSLKCDIHPWMSAWVHVAEHPWFDVTDADGIFAIRDVPPGDYVLEVTHEIFGSLSGRVTVTASQSTGLELTLTYDD